MSKAKFTKSQIKDLIEVYQAEVQKLNFQAQNARSIIAALKSDLKKAPNDVKPAAKKVTRKKVTKKAAPKKAAKKVTRKKVAKKAAPKKVVKKVTRKKVAKKAAPKKVVKKVTRKKVTKKAAPKKVVKKVTRKKVTKKAAPKKVVRKTTAKKGAGRKPIVTPWDKFVMDSIKKAGKGLNSASLFVTVKAAAKAAKVYKNDATTKTLINRSLQKLVNTQKVLGKFKYAGRGFAYGLPAWGNRGRLKPQYKA